MLEPVPKTIDRYLTKYFACLYYLYVVLYVDFKLASMLCLPPYLPNFFYTHTMEAATEVWNGNQNNCYNRDGYGIPEIRV